ncbi:MAG TPA: hypothetical protein VH186_03875 [Chloroflexia bacterium]|nr:hypothetical protein [Chloroflexia bacterium]
MPQFPAVFPWWWVALTSIVALIASFGLVRWRFKELSSRESWWLALVVGLSVLAWRLAGNIKELNDDPLPPFSPNDWLCPVITYIFLGVYAAFRTDLKRDGNRWEQVRALLTIVSLVANVLVI